MARKRICTTALLAVLKRASILLLVSSIVSAPADGAVATTFGSGIDICDPPLQPVSLVNPITVTDCTRAGIQSALDVGGHSRFGCGPDPIIIPIDTVLEISTVTDTVLDGGGQVTLDGQGVSRILYKGWHDPDTVGTINVTIQNMRFINARAPHGGDTDNHSGGAISSGHPGTSLHLINCTFESNATTDVATEDNQGGAIFSSNSYETVISGCVFEGNTAGNGGAFGGIATGLFVFNTRFAGNRAIDTTSGGVVRGYGGAIYLDGVTNSYNPSSNKRVHICGSIFEDNTAVRGGGATAVAVSDNKGIKVTYEGSTFHDNRVSGLNGSYGQGGAVYHIEDDHAGGIDEDNLEILQSTFHGNQARRQGGAVWLYINGHGDILNATFEGNSTSAPFNEVGQGGAMAITLGIIDIINVTFANNHAAYQGGALHGSSSEITLQNTIFYSNTLNEQDLPSETRWQGYHTNKPMDDGGQNIQFPRLKPTYNNDVNNNITANPIYADPLFEPLADNGGPNRTMALQEGSPAIDAGADGCPATDQRGKARDGRCDIGAYEYIPNRIHVTPTMQAIAPGRVATYRIQVQTRSSFTHTLVLTATRPSTDLGISIAPCAITYSQVATLIVTDTHVSPTLLPGLWYTIPITAAGGDLTLSTQARLLVGGGRVYLPLVTGGI